MKRRLWGFFAAALVVSMGTVAFVMLPEDEADQSVSLLFVQTATSGRLVPIADSAERYLMTLEGVTDHTIWFSDRPQRLAGQFTTGEFVGAWGTGENSFFDSPPNAALEIANGDTRGDVVVVELINPEYDVESGVLQYKVRLLEGTDGKAPASSNEQADQQLKFPREFGSVALFIDAISVNTNLMSLQSQRQMGNTSTTMKTGVTRTAPAVQRLNSR